MRQHVIEVRASQRHRRQPCSVVEGEESGKRRLTQIDVDEGDAAAGPGERDSEVCDGRRLALVVSRAGEHNRPRVAVKIDQLEIRGDDPKRLCRGVLRR